MLEDLIRDNTVKLSASKDMRDRIPVAGPASWRVALTRQPLCRIIPELNLEPALLKHRRGCDAP